MIDVGPLDDLPQESMCVVRVGTRELGIVRWHGNDVYAVHNRCPHMAGPLCLGALGPRLDGRPGEVRVTDVPVIACPWHHWEFDARDGRSISGDPARVRTYPARVEGGRILVDLRPRPA